MNIEIGDFYKVQANGTDYGTMKIMGRLGSMFVGEVLGFGTERTPVCFDDKGHGIDCPELKLSPLDAFAKAMIRRAF